MRTFITSITLIFVFTFSACSNTHWLHKDAVPTDVAKPGYTLLILKLDDTESRQTYQQFVNEKLEKLVKDYPYPVVLVTKQELNSAQYSDVAKYRYVLKPTGITSQSNITDTYKPAGGGFTQKNTTSYVYTEQVFTDRKANKDYPLTHYSVVRFDQGVKVILQYIKKTY